MHYFLKAFFLRPYISWGQFWTFLIAFKVKIRITNNWKWNFRKQLVFSDASAIATHFAWGVSRDRWHTGTHSMCTSLVKTTSKFDMSMNVYEIICVCVDRGLSSQTCHKCKHHKKEDFFFAARINQLFFFCASLGISSRDLGERLSWSKNISATQNLSIWKVALSFFFLSGVGFVIITLMRLKSSIESWLPRWWCHRLSVSSHLKIIEVSLLLPSKVPCEVDSHLFAHPKSTLGGETQRERETATNCAIVCYSKKNNNTEKFALHHNMKAKNFLGWSIKLHKIECNAQNAQGNRVEINGMLLFLL